MFKHPSNFIIRSLLLCLVFAFVIGQARLTQAQPKNKSAKTLSYIADSFVKALAKGDYKLAKKHIRTFKSEAELLDVDFEEYWQNRVMELGAYKRHKVNLLELDNTTLITVTCQFDRGIHEIQFLYDTSSGFLSLESKNIENKIDAKFLYLAAQRARESVLKLVTSNNYIELYNLFADHLDAQRSFEKYQQLRLNLGNPIGFPSVYAESEPTLRTANICGTSNDVKNICIGIQFENGQLIAEVTINKNYRIETLTLNKNFESTKASWSSPSYAKSSDLFEEKVLFGSNEWKLEGVLTYPKKKISSLGYPIVILISGGPGPADADYTYGTQKIFKDLAWGLAAQGIATFRYEKRAFAHYEKFYHHNSYTFVEDTLSDAYEAVATVQQKKLIDSRNIFVLGHSMGGIAAAQIVNSKKNLRGGILMATSSGSFIDNTLSQAVYLSTYWRQANTAKQSLFLTGYDKSLLQNTKHFIAAVKNNRIPNQFSTQKTYVGHPISFWRDVKNYNSSSLLLNSTVPVLIQSANRDERILFTENQPKWIKLASKRSGITLKEYSALDHSMSLTRLDTGAKQLSEEVVFDISSWIKDQIQ